MDEYTFIAEDAAAAADGSIPAIQQVSAEELYRRELAEEMQVALQYMSCQEHVICLASKNSYTTQIARYPIPLLSRI